MLLTASTSLLPRAVVVWAAASAGVALASLAGTFVGVLDLLNQVAPFWLLAALAGLAAARFAPAGGRTRRWCLAAFAGAALIHGALIAPEFMRARNVAEAPDSAPHIRVVWLNAQSGAAGQSVTEYLLSTGADFILLSEFHAEGQMVTPTLAAAYPNWATCAEPHWCNVVILARQAAQAARPLHEASPNELRVVWADYDVDGAPLRLVATHLQRPYPVRRAMAQRSELLGILASGPSAATVLAGDFNSAPWSFALRDISAASGLSRQTRAIPTWPAAPWTRLRLPAPFAFMPIDHVFSGENWRLVSIRRGPRTGADHYPIEAEFVWVGER
jgi:endonuclease/exonuclease/phosphatase (EEP) superfamily protein YafD